MPPSASNASAAGLSKLLLAMTSGYARPVIGAAAPAWQLRCCCGGDHIRCDGLMLFLGNRCICRSFPVRLSEEEGGGGEEEAVGENRPVGEEESILA